MKLNINRLIIAGTGSGSGKTTVTAGLLRCLKNRNIPTASFKCGPDYIDPMFHSRITGRQAGTLDPYFCDASTLRYLVAKESEGCDIAVAEGVMGYYDGIGFTSEASTYSVARSTQTPVILVVGCRGAAASVGAVLRGFLDYPGADSMIRGVIFNNISARLAPRAMEMAASMGVEPLGYLPTDRRLTLESRHLGLVTADEVKNFDSKAAVLADVMEKTVDVDRLLKIASEAEALSFEPPEALSESALGGRGDGVKVAVARDQAFNFIYRENMDILAATGCEIEYFSPLGDDRIPEDADGLILSGGYPELYASSLSINKNMRRSVRTAIDMGLPVIAECGGFMYLHSILEGSDGARYPMAGVIDGSCADSGSLGRFGYVEITAEKDGLLCAKGESVKAHEFHYWDSTNPGSDFTAVKPDGSRTWKCGFQSERMYAGFPHVHFASSSEVCLRFVDRCAEHRGKQEAIRRARRQGRKK